MVFDTISNIRNYKGLDKVYTALEFLAKTDFTQMELGKYILDDNIFYMVQSYDTKETGAKTEAHKAYIDIQYIVSGKEIIAVAPLTGDSRVVEEKPEKDVWFYDCETTPMVLEAGSFMVLYPNDLHKPGMAVGKSAPCRKVVVKVKCDE